MPNAILDQLNLVVSNMDRSIEFYRAIGVDLPEDEIWRTDTGAHHVVMKMPDGFELALDSVALAEVYNQGWRDPATNVSPNVLSFRLGSAQEVDERCQTLSSLGYGIAQEPYYTFWGSRYAIVLDPDGNHVGLMSLPDRDHRGPPPAI